MTDNIVAMPGCRVPRSSGTNPAPNVELVHILKRLLEMAESGDLQSFIGTGFTADCGRVLARSTPDPDHNIYEMVGAIEYLKSEYMQYIDLRGD